MDYTTKDKERVLKEHLKNGGFPLKFERNAQIYDLHKKGLSYFQISKELGYSLTPSAIGEIIRVWKNKVLPLLEEGDKK